jgi:hypothetical protein
MVPESAVPADPATAPSADEKFFLSDRARLKRWLPWLLMFRSFRLALQHRQLAVSLLAVWLCIAGESAYLGLQAQLSQSNGDIAETATVPTVSQHIPQVQAALDGETLPFREILQGTDQLSLQQFIKPQIVLWPLGLELEATVRVFRPLPTWLHWGLELGRWIWISLIMLLAGGILSRLAALELTQFIECRLITAARFVCSNFGTYAGGGATALAAFAVLGLFNVLLGLLALIPLIGPSILWLGWPLALAMSTLLALLAICLAGGWPLMICAASVEASDPLDGLSRSFNYLLARPWYAVFLTLLLILYGSALLYFVTGMVQFALWLTLHSVGRFSPIETSSLAFWNLLLNSVVPAILFSLFWTTSTIIYLLLRRSEDATPIQSVYVERGAAADLPLFGIPAAEYRERQRSRGTTNESGQPGT